MLAFHSLYCKPIPGQLFQLVIDIIVANRVANRPDRFEPRRKKRRPKPYDRLMKPGSEMKRQMLQGNFA